MTRDIHLRRSRSGGIGTKILLPVGAVFILFTIGLATLIGVTNQNNLTSIKFAELERMSRILANNVAEVLDKASLVAQGMEQSERLTREIAQIATFGPITLTLAIMSIRSVLVRRLKRLMIRIRSLRSDQISIF